MSNLKSDGLPLRKQYGVHLQIGFILSLTLLLAATRLPLPSAEGIEAEMDPQETVDLRHIQQTRYEKTPPAPPRPPVPKAVPNDKVVGPSDLEFDASLDAGAALGQAGSLSSPRRPGPGVDSETDGVSEADKVFVDVQERPDCGGAQALQDKVRYPPSAQAAGLEGRVFVQFIVGTEGQVKSPRVVRGAHEMLDQVALRAAEKLDCTPGKQRSRPVKVKMTMPVTFALDGS